MNHVIRKLILDLIGGAFGLIALGIGVFVLEGNNLQSILNTPSALLNNFSGVNGNLIRTLSILSITLGSVVIVLSFFSSLLLFKTTAHMELTYAIYVMALAAIIVAIYAIIKIKLDFNEVFNVIGS